MAAIFLAQATNTDLTLWQELGIIGILLLTSKGAAGVTGSGFIVLAATLASVGTILAASIALISAYTGSCRRRGRSRTLLGNGLATVVVANGEERSTRTAPPTPQPGDGTRSGRAETVKVEEDVVEAGGLQPIRV